MGNNKIEKQNITACKHQLKDMFENDFKIQGLNAKYNFYNITNRDNLIKSIAKDEQERDYLEENYNKILNIIIKKYELNEQYKEYQKNEELKEYSEKMEAALEMERKKQQRENIFFNIINLIFGHPFIILFIVIIGFLVSMFMGALDFSFLPALGLSIVLIIVLILGFLGFI